MRVVNSFIQNLDTVGSQSLVIAATNHEQLLELVGGVPAEKKFCAALVIEALQQAICSARKSIQR